MFKIGIAAFAAVIATLGVTGASIHAQEPTVDDVRAQFQGLTIADAEAMGYAQLTPCVDASELPAGLLADLGIPATAAQGIHYLNEGLVDTTLTALEPELILFGPDGAIWNVEYITPPQAEPLSVLGQTLVFNPEVDLDALHVWVIDNPAGQFADFNPAVTCGGPALPATGSGGLADSGSATSAALWAGIAAMAVVGLAIAGRFARRPS